MNKSYIKHFSSELLAFIMLIVYIFIISLIDIDFLQVKNLYSLIYSASIYIPAIIGMQILIITGYFDLSIGSIAAFIGIIVSIISQNLDFMILSIFVALLVSIFLGLINSLLVVDLKIHSLIATIATMMIIRGLALIFSSGTVLIGLPLSYQDLARSSFFGIETPIIISVILIIFLSYLCVNAIQFRRFYQVGSNPIAAFECGINNKYTIRIAFVFSSVGAAFTGLLGTSRTMSASPIIYESLALDIIAACVLGGASLKGGKGSIIGAIIGLLIVKVSENVVIFFGIALYWRYVIIGLILLVFILLNIFLSKIKKNLIYHY